MKAVQPLLYLVWITVLTEVYDDLIIAGMVKKGYIVSSAASDKKVVAKTKNSSAAVISLRIESFDPKVSAKMIQDDVLGVMEGHKMFFHSVIVANGSSDSCWISSNIIFEPKVPPTPTPPPVPEDGKKNLN